MLTEPNGRGFDASAHLPVGEARLRAIGRYRRCVNTQATIAAVLTRKGAERQV